jgi:hypothetical protein
LERHAGCCDSCVDSGWRSLPDIHGTTPQQK